jgi:protein O-GlcNAc transferase
MSPFGATIRTPPACRYRITDWVADPAGAEDNHSEVLIRLPRCFLCYAVPEQAPPIAPPPLLENGFVTFGSFNNLAKVNGQVIGLWAEVMKAVPASRLLLKATGTGDPATQTYLRDRFAAAGVAPERIRFADYAPTPRDHLLAYGQIDIALDTFPYNGTTTTCDALWMGVPVVTLEGDRHAARVGASLLGTIGFEAGIARSPDDYVGTAALMAENPALFATARRSLRSELARSPLTDHMGFAAIFEDALRALCQMHCAGERPERWGEP